MKATFEKEEVLNLDDQKVKQLAQRIRELNLNDGEIDFSDDEVGSLYRQDANRLRQIRGLWENNGRDGYSNRRVSIKSLLDRDVQKTKEFNQQLRKLDDDFSTDHPLLLPRVISEMAREAIEPQLTLTPLMTRVEMASGTRITFPAWGAARAFDIAEGEEYPEFDLDVAGQVEAIVGKSGIAFKVTEEQIQDSQYDVIGMRIRAAGRALARLKEQKVADLITTDQGNVIFDNSTSSVRSTTGRDASGNYNGTLTLDDLFHAYAVMVDRGFTPNGLIMHPFAWQIFAQESIARAFGFVNGFNPLLWQAAQGSPGNANPWRQGGLNQNTYVSSPGNIATTFTNVPSIFPTNFRIVVSPFMPYTASNQTTDIILADLNELGIIAVREDVMTDEWNDPARDIMKMKFRERYGMAVMNDGKSIGLMKSVKVARGFDFADKLSVSIDETGLDARLSGDANYSGDLF